MAIPDGMDNADVPFDRVQPIAAIRDVRWANILIGRNQVLDTHRNQDNQMCKITSLNRHN